MPTYEYKCLSCSYKFEKFQSMMDEPLSVCPECNGDIKRLIGAGSGPIFKGSGFYHTDYKNSSKNSGNKTSGKSKPEAKPVTENKTEAK